MRPLYIFDLDGTLALVDHRRHFVERPACPYCSWTKPCDHDLPLEKRQGADSGLSGVNAGVRVPFKPDWRAFYAACVHDQPNVPVIQTLQALRSSGAEIWIWSGRSDEVRQQTVDWLRLHIGRWSGFEWFRAPEAFLMRKADDFTPDDELKLGWLAGLEPPERARLTAVFDDRDKVVAMWRKFGVPCFQVAPGGF